MKLIALLELLLHNRFWVDLKFQQVPMCPRPDERLNDIDLIDWEKIANAESGERYPRKCEIQRKQIQALSAHIASIKSRHRPIPAATHRLIWNSISLWNEEKLAISSWALSFLAPLSSSKDIWYPQWIPVPFFPVYGSHSSIVWKLFSWFPPNLI